MVKVPHGIIDANKETLLF